jgi:hypothetical protein
LDVHFVNLNVLCFVGLAFDFSCRQLVLLVDLLLLEMVVGVGFGFGLLVCSFVQLPLVGFVS